MINIKDKIYQIGLDKAISYTIVGRISQAFGSIVSIILVGKYLNLYEQGYYYTFGSIIAIQVFFELGLTNVIVQYVAYEKAHLSWHGNFLIGNDKFIFRLSSILRLLTKWYLSLSMLLFFTLLIIGFLFFGRLSNLNEGINWQYPWIVLVIGTSILLILTATIGFYEGLEKAEECAKIRMYQQLFQIIALVFFLLVGTKLYAIGLSILVGCSVVIFNILFSNIRKVLYNIWIKKNINIKIDWKKEVLPYQWRIALSWISGYFIFQLFNPILFVTQGPVVAGQMGMSMSIVQGVSTLANSWVKTKVPSFSVLIAQKKGDELNIYFSKTIRQALTVLLVLNFMVMVFVVVLKISNVQIVKRFLGLLPLFLLFITSFFQLTLDAMATYLRCHKKEPFLLLSLLIGVTTCIMVYIASRNFGVTEVIISYLLVMLLANLWGYEIFKKKRLEWYG